MSVTKLEKTVTSFTIGCLLLTEADEVPGLAASTTAPRGKGKGATKKSVKGSPKTKKNDSSKKPKRKDLDGSKSKDYELTPYGKAKKEFSLQCLGQA